jgi:hypothetical protein
VDPIGFVEVTGDTTRFVPIQEHRFVLAALGVGLAAGLLLGRRWAGRSGCGTGASSRMD